MIRCADFLKVFTGLLMATLVCDEPRAEGAEGNESRTVSSTERIVVTGSSELSGLDGLLGGRIDPSEAPVDLSRIPAWVLVEPGNQSLASVLAREATIGQNYATSGYYQNFTLRGFTLDLGSSYRINGFVVPGEFDIPLDNVESVEVLKGIAGMEGGQVGPGGTINFVTRRSAGVNAFRGEVTQTGGRLVSIDMGQVVGADSRLGVRMDVTHADLRPHQPDAGGSRDLLSLAVDSRLTPTVWVMSDLILQRRSQPAVPGFQLLAGTMLPDSSVRDVNINRQPWSRPVTNDGVMADVRAEWRVSDKFWVDGGLADTVARIGDNLATPWGCNTPPVQYFCANGDYVLYDYHASERRSGLHLTASLHALVETGPASHALTIGLERIGRSILQDDLYSSTTYDSNGNALTGNLASTANPLPAPVGVGSNLPKAKAVQTAAFVADRIAIGSFSTVVSLRDVEIVQQPAAIRESHLLPQIGALWDNLPGQTVYLSHGSGIAFGSQAPLTAANAGALLSPRRTNQTEMGWKGNLASGATWVVTAFRMEQPYEFTQPTGTSWAGLGDYVRGGNQVNTGLDFSAQTPPDRPLRLEGSLAHVIAKASGTGIAAFEGVQAQNVPRWSSFLRATQAVSAVPGLDVSLGWTHQGRRNARRDGEVTVPGYDVLDAGASVRHIVAGHSVIFAVTVRNLTDRRYWRDVGEAYSADLLFPGDARSAAASVRVGF